MSHGGHAESYVMSMGVGGMGVRVLDTNMLRLVSELQ